jgi:hypothetical protein
MDKVAKCGVMDNILSFAAFKNQKALGKSDGAKRSRLVGRCNWVVETTGLQSAVTAGVCLGDCHMAAHLATAA